jgi:hypothetical protein
MEASRVAFKLTPSLSLSKERGNAKNVVVSPLLIWKRGLGGV